MDLNAAGVGDLHRHGDADAEPGLVDFAVNVRPTPLWMAELLAARVADLARYPAAADHDRAVAAVAAVHGRPVDEVLLLAGAAEGFALLPRLRPRLAALIQPSFTEPERVLRAAGVPIAQVVLDEPWRLDPDAVPAAADLVVLGNPTNPTGVLHPRESIEALRRPGRTIVVDEAFADLVPGEAESIAARRYPDVLVVRSITKSFGLAGLRAGYLLGAPAVLRELGGGRPHWPLGTLQLAAVAAAASDRGRRYLEREAKIVARQRESMVETLGAAGLRVVGASSAPFVLVDVGDGPGFKEALRQRGFAIRGCDNFVGMDGRFVRLAVRDADTVAELVDAVHSVMQEVC
ncbi:Rv2231c family pyridoxal phosphate-dependent protein CobC [Jongsikchunia kroppenstedtii]|uniref:Rv2231c family pyridoxal phosphate-dependent protein CobC n=1 Tax=Jongsikchunia kroppenstedtii TaxID=1121721 RepID=UPI0003620338